MKPVKIMIVDDHLVIREGLRQLLQIEDNFSVVAEAENGMDCLSLLETHHPDVVLMDVRMPGITGIETARIVCKKYPGIKVIMLTMYEDSQYVTEAMKAGAKGYILKNVKRDDLICAIQHVIDGRAFLDPNVTDSVLQCLADDGLKADTENTARLSKREMEVLQFMVEGDSDRNISKRMNISVHTVRSHIKNMYRKLGVSSKSQAVSLALQKKMIT